MSTGRTIYDVHATKTDSAGNGYYRASDGYYYYGNTQNGYLVETEETKRLKAAKAAQNTTFNPTGSVSSCRSTGKGNPIMDRLAIKAGTKLGQLLAIILFTVIPFLFKVVMVFGALPAMAADYVREFIFYGTAGYRLGYKFLSAVVFITIVALIGYGVYRKIKGKNNIAKQVFWCEALCLTGTCYLNTKEIVSSILMAVFAAYLIKVFSAWLEKIVYNIRKRINAKK